MGESAAFADKERLIAISIASDADKRGAGDAAEESNLFIVTVSQTRANKLDSRPQPSSFESQLVGGVLEMKSIMTFASSLPCVS